MYKQMKAQKQIDQNSLKNLIAEEQWANVDQLLPPIPTALFTFSPHYHNQLHYRRLLYCLSEELIQQKAFHLTSYLLFLNSSNYYALMLRQKYIKKILINKNDNHNIQSVVTMELLFMNHLLRKNPKQYQIWNYKKDVISDIFTYNLEITKTTIRSLQSQFIFQLLTNQDEKIYHVWDYRGWLVRKLGIIQQELKQTESMIFTQFEEGGVKCDTLWTSCYSCWSHRLTLIMELTLQRKRQMIQQQIRKVLLFLRKNEKNECAWNYLIGLLRIQVLNQKLRQQIIEEVSKYIRNQKEQNRFGWSFMLKVGSGEMKKLALENLKVIDSARRHYYQYLESNNLLV